MGIFDGMNDIFGIDNTISQSSNIQPDDVLKTKTALSQTGHYQVPDFGLTDIPDMGMIDGLKGFQQDNGLKVDGVMKPGGPTETKLGETLAHQGIGNMDLLEQSKPKTPKIDPLTGVEEIKMPKLKKPTKAQWDQVAEIQKPKQTPWFQSPQIQPVEDEAHSANTRTMDGLLKYSVNGSLPYLYADSIKNGGDKAVNEYANFMQQLNDRKGDRVETFHQEVMDRLPETHKQKFAALEMQDDRHETPLGQDNGNEHAERFQATNHQLPENDQAGPSHYRTASTETSYSQPTAAAMMVESNGDDKTSLAHPYDNGEAPTQRRYNRRKKLGKRKLDATEDRLRTGSKIGRNVGLGDAADHLDQFLDGDDTDRTVHRDEARKDPFIRRAEDNNRKRYEDRTFTGTTGNPELNKKLRHLKDGESVEFEDDWDTGQSDFDSVIDNARIGFKDGANNYLKYGRQGLRSHSKIRATRRGNKIHYEGVVDHNADDDYDFHDGRSGGMTGAKDMQDSGRGKKFKTKRRWKQKVSGSVDIDGWKEGEGHVLRRPKAKWDDFE
ncbi:hypothetical protein [Terasakiella sp.]|uniref:hypothetical protein n=1 Tax=Terasakiella sp. TaxID=2034861 RepID=UPI003AA89386